MCMMMAFKGVFIVAAFLTVANTLPSQCSIIFIFFFIFLNVFLRVKLPRILLATTMMVAGQGYVYSLNQPGLEH